MLDTPTWRANPDWAGRIGHSAEQLANLNRRAVTLLETLRDEHATDDRTPIVVSGCVGPRGDGYVAAETMSADEAAAYHATQIGIFADTGADLVTALTLTYADEALGIVRAARNVGLPVVISFTLGRQTGACRAASRSAGDRGGRPGFRTPRPRTS